MLKIILSACLSLAVFVCCVEVWAQENSKNEPYKFQQYSQEMPTYNSYQNVSPTDFLYDFGAWLHGAGPYPSYFWSCCNDRNSSCNQNSCYSVDNQNTTVETFDYSINSTDSK